MTTKAGNKPLLTYDVEPLTEKARFKLVRPENGPSDRRLPELWYYVGQHPQVPAIAQNYGRTFVSFIDPTPEGQQKWHTIAGTLSIPHGHLADVVKSQPCMFFSLNPNGKHSQPSKAWTELKAGDYVFLRDCRGNGNPMHDILVMWVGNAYIRLCSCNTGNSTLND